MDDPRRSPSHGPETFDEACDACHHPPAGRLAAHVDVAVVCVTHETVAATFKLAIQFIQHEIREQGRERAALRGAPATCLEWPATKHAGGEGAPDATEHPTVGHAGGHRGRQ